MQQPATRRRRRRRDHSHRRIVHCNGLRRLIFGQIHRRIGGGIDDPVRAALRNRSRDGSGISDVEFSARLCHYLMGNGRCGGDRTRHLTSTAQHQHFHANFPMSAKLLPTASLADSFGTTPAGKGQRTFDLASSQARVRSCSGL